MKHNVVLLTLLVIFLITGCTPNKAAAAAETPTAAIEQPSSTPENTPTEAATETPLPTETPSYTATPDNRIAPEKWKTWSVVPEVSETVLDIYRHGRELGRNPNAFTKIGDCQNIKEAFMGFFDRQNVFLSESQQGLRETIDNFAGYFDHDGYAVEGGLNAPSALNPLMSDPNACAADENPLQCEVRNNNPSFAFVSFELWYKGRSAENYEGYLRQILDYLISEGVVPILLTKADNTEGDDSINYTIAKLAYEYDIPMVNWWYTAHTMTDNGMDPTRNDGFHISPDAWTERSYDALETLDKIWRAVRDIQ